MERDLFRAEDQARTGHPDLGKVVLYQMSYFRLCLIRTSFCFWECKNRILYDTTKLFCKFFLFVLRCVQRAALYLYIRLAFIALLVQFITHAY